VLLGAGCASTHDEAGSQSAVSSAKPSIAVTVKSAPSQDPNGNPPVRFDPCTEIDDATVLKAGFDPKTRQRSDQLHTGYAFIGCTFDRKEMVRGQELSVGSLVVSSTTITLDQFRQREGAAASEININSKEAITYRTPEAEACNVVIKDGPDGTIDVGIDSTEALTDWQACDHAQEIAAIIDLSITKK
jgi:hypothetical protein